MRQQTQRTQHRKSRRILTAITAAATVVAVPGLVVLTAPSASASPGQTVTDLNTITASDLVNTIVGSGVTTSNIVYTGSPNGAGTFSGFSTIGIDNGIILSSGNAADAVGPNDSQSKTGALDVPGDPDLDALVSPNATTDASVLSFDFVPTTAQLTFDYVFSSEEYNEYANSSFNDVFAFFVNGTNCALTPDNAPVSINNINGGNPLGTDPQRPELYRDNTVDPVTGVSPFDVQADGMTVDMHCTANVNPGVTNHMKLAIADTSDTSLDSTVFIRAGSVKANHPPTANGQSVSTPQGIAKAITLTGTDPDGDALTYAVASPPAHGTLSGTAPNVTYTPNAGYTGTDAFTFTTNDGAATSTPATVNITVTAVNHPPTANGQSVSTPQGIAKAITLTGTDPDGDALTYAVASPPAHGTLSGTAPNVTYTPNAGYTGTDAFTFTTNDGAATSTPATVNITVTAVNHPPTANGQSVSTPQGIAKAITLTGTDPDGDALTYAVASPPAHGTLSGTAPNVTYTPNAGYTGTDAFTFTTNDGAATSTPATVNITVTAVNHPPTANGQSVSTPQGIAKAITLTGTDPDGDALTYAVASPPAHGTLSGTAPNVTYTPNAGYTGTDAFTFTTNDGAATSTPATVNITVTATSTGCMTTAPAVDSSVSADQSTASKTIIAAHLSTAGAGELLVATVEADGPATNGAQEVTSVSGSGLTWSLVTRSNKTWGTAEVWQAYATNKLTNVTITANLKKAYDGSITVTAFTGAAHQVGNSAAAGAKKGVPTVTITPHACGSLVYGAGHDWDPARTVSAGTGQSLIHVFKDTRVNDTDWSMKADTPATTTTPVSLTVGGITTDRWQLVAVEIPAAS